MAEEADKDQGNGQSSSAAEKDTGVQKKKRRGIISRIWNGLFRRHGDDFEKRLQHISKEEASVLARMKRRSQSSRTMTRNLIVLSVILEVNLLFSLCPWNIAQNYISEIVPNVNGSAVSLCCCTSFFCPFFFVMNWAWFILFLYILLFSWSWMLVERVDEGERIEVIDI